MLFLAVFCSFLAELQLEDKIEKNREIECMKGTVDKYDITRCDKNAQNNIDYSSRRVYFQKYIEVNAELLKLLRKEYHLK